MTNTFSNDVICSKSWTDVSIRLMHNDIQHCCKAESETYSSLTKQFINNSPNIQERREFMINGKFHSSCKKCYGWRNIKNKYLEIPENPDTALEFLEIYFDNVCKLSCLYCHPKFSNTIAKQMKIENPTKIPTQSEIDFLVEYLSESNFNKKITLSILGGEPTSSQNYFYFLDSLAKNASEKEFVILTTTNGAMNENTMKRIQKRMNSSPITWDWWWSFSGESIDEVYDSIRFGGNFKTWRNNLSLLAAHDRTKGIGFNAAVSLLSLKTLPNFMHYVLSSVSKQYYFPGNYIIEPVELSVSKASPDAVKYVHEAKEIFLKNSSLCINKHEVIKWFDELEQKIGSEHYDEEELRKFLERQQIYKKNKLNINLLMKQVC